MQKMIGLLNFFEKGRNREPIVGREGLINAGPPMTVENDVFERVFSGSHHSNFEHKMKLEK